MLTQLQSQSEHWYVVQMLHTANLLRPNVLELKLNAFDWKQEAIERIVLFMDVWAEHQVNWPLAFVNQREATPRILLVRFDTTFEHPVLNHENVREVGRLLAEA